MTAKDPPRVAYIEPKQFFTALCPLTHKRGWPGFLDGLESTQDYHDLGCENYATCASEHGICSDRGCAIAKGQIRFTRTRFDYNYDHHTWYKPQSYCLQCAPPYQLTMCGLNTDHLPKDAHPLLGTVVKIADDEPIFYKGFGSDGEWPVEDMAKNMDECELREYKKVKRAYDRRKAKARANPRLIPDRVLKYRCEDNSLLKPEPNGTSVNVPKANPFEQPDLNVLMNWVRVEY